MASVQEIYHLTLRATEGLLASVVRLRVSARSFAGQAAQLLVWRAVLNEMTHLGIPESYAA
ncbi:MAG: hypothetical protein ACR2LZ_01175 [Pyrinomonadaceae bacterium]